GRFKPVTNQRLRRHQAYGSFTLPAAGFADSFQGKSGLHKSSWLYCIERLRKLELWASGLLVAESAVTCVPKAFRFLFGTEPRVQFQTLLARLQSWLTCAITFKFLSQMTGLYWTPSSR